jgi:hypothetical protein
VRPVDNCGHVSGLGLGHAGELGAVNRRADGKRTLGSIGSRETQAFEEVFVGHGNGLIRYRFARPAFRRGAALGRDPVFRPQIRPPGKSGEARLPVDKIT